MGPAATKFRRGACENCGAMTHKTKDCLSRPRAKGARWTGKDIQADEVVQDVDLGWDAKRDRWNGYDATEYQAVIEEYDEMERLKKQAKGAKASGQKLLAEDGTEKNEYEGEEAKYAEESDMGRQQSTATRNLRLREDTAKYLLNLDLDSAKYDPKTRSMVDMGAQADQAAALVAEDNFMRASGDAAEFERAQKYAWESQERGDKNKTHIQANPTLGEYFLRKEEETRRDNRDAHQKMLLEKYGGDQLFQLTPLRNAAVIENEQYVEYDASGAIKGVPTIMTRSKYPEDVHINNHTSVWGSWWKDFKWGYACCHSTIKHSYCAGEQGRKAYEEADQIRMGGELEAMDITHTKQQVTKEIEYVQPNGINDSVVNGNTGNATKKRTMTETKNGVMDEELEAYKRTRLVADDPMFTLLGKDELVH